MTELATAAPAWMLGSNLLTHGNAGTSSSILALFSLCISTVIQALRKNARPMDFGQSAKR